MNKRAEFDQNLAHARALLKYREEHYYPDKRIYGHIKEQMDLSEKIANGKKKYSKHLDEINMANVAIREIEDMDPEFSDAISTLELSLCELLGVEI